MVSDVLFWPDMASIHYESDVQNWLQSKGIQFVKYKDNAPNVPQASPIENFWHLCSKEYFKTTTASKTVEEFEKIWTKISKTVAKRHGKALMGGTRKLVRMIGKEGVFAPFKNENNLRI